ncbi:unnamed protein product, partial [Mycena citricolor]
PRLVQALVLVAAISERAHGVDVERILPLTDDRLARLDFRVLRLFVHLARVVAQPLVQQRRLLCRIELHELPLGHSGASARERLLVERVLDHVELISMGREEFAPPRPFEPPVAGFAWPVVVADRAVSFVDHRVRLEPVGQHDVGIHSRYIQMVDQRLVVSHRLVAQQLKRHLNFSLDFIVVRHVLQRGLGLFNDAELERSIQIVDELQHQRAQF